MHMSIGQAILIGIVYYLGFIGTPWLSLLGSISVVYRPLVSGTLVGLILGDPVQGAIIGAAINLPYLGFISAGGTVPVDPGLAGVLGTALAMAADVSPQVALTLAIPLGLLGTILWITHMTVDVVFVHMADAAAEKGDARKICMLHVVPPQIICAIITIVPVALGAYFGGDFVKSIIAAIGGKPLYVLQVIGGVLPALGIAMNLRAIAREGSLVFYVLGFLISVYLKLDIITVAAFAAITAYVFTTLMTKGDSVNGTLSD